MINYIYNKLIQTVQRKKELLVLFIFLSFWKRLQYIKLETSLRSLDLRYSILIEAIVYGRDSTTVVAEGGGDGDSGISTESDFRMEGVNGPLIEGIYWAS